jgi:hypothetical protein
MSHQNENQYLRANIDGKDEHFIGSLLSSPFKVHGMTKEGEEMYHLLMPLENRTNPGTYPLGKETLCFLMKGGSSIKGFEFESGELKIESIDPDNGNIKATFFGISGDPKDENYPKITINNGEINLTEFSPNQLSEFPEAVRKSR